MYVKVTFPMKSEGRAITGEMFFGPFVHPITSSDWVNRFKKKDKENKFTAEHSTAPPAHIPVYDPEFNPEILCDQLVALEQLSQLVDAS